MTKVMKDSGVEWIGEIPENWSLVRLRYLCDIKTGNKDTVNRMDDGEYPFYVRSPKIERIDSYSFDREAVLTAGDGAGVGKVFHYVNEKFDYHQRVYNIHNFKEVFGKYLFHYVRTNFIKEIEKGTAKSTVESVRLPMLLNFPICFPSIEKQQRIANFLDKKTSQIDSIISDTKKSLEELKKYKRALITETVTKGLNRDVKTKDSGIEWIGEIPEHWDMTKMKRLGSVRNGLTYSPEDIVDEEGGTLVLRSGNIQNAKLAFKDTAYVSCNINDSLYVKNGDILICSRNGSRSLIGKNAIIDTDMKATFGAFMMLLRTEELSKYIYYILNSEVFNFYLGTFLTATINQLTKNNFDNMNVVYCANPEEQQQIADYLDEKCAHIDSLIADKEKLIGEFEDYKKALVYEYVTGKKEVE